MSQLAAFAITLLVEVPVYALALAVLCRLTLRRGILIGVGVNALTHPALWWTLAPRPTTPALILAEIVVCVVEATVTLVVVRRDFPLLLAISVAANAASVAAGLVVSAAR